MEEKLFFFDLNYHDDHSFTNPNKFYDHILNHLFEYENEGKVKINYITFIMESTDELPYDYSYKYYHSPCIKIIKSENILSLEFNDLEENLVKISQLENFLEFRMYDYDNPNHKNTDKNNNEIIIERYDNLHKDSYKDSFRKQNAFLIDKHKHEFKFMVYPTIDAFNERKYTESYSLKDIKQIILNKTENNNYVKIVWGSCDVNFDTVCSGEPFSLREPLMPAIHETITTIEMLDIELNLLTTKNEKFIAFILEM